MKLSFLLVEMAALSLFVWGLIETRKKGAPRLLEYVMIFFYGLLLEELDMRIFKTYHYAPHFFFKIGQVPVSIAWLWAVILASSMAISDRLPLREPFRPFADALLAVWIDLSIDAIAIRMGYWNWTIPLNEGWFGVPAGNLYAWMWVAFFYSALSRALRRLLEKDKRWAWAFFILPFFAYAGLFLAMVSLGFIGKAIGFTSQAERLVLFWAQFLVFMVLVLLREARGEARSEAVASVWKWGRLAIQIYFLCAFFIFGFFRQVPILGVITLFTLGGEGMLNVVSKSLSGLQKRIIIFLVFLLSYALPADAVPDSENPQDWYDRARADLEVAQLVFDKTQHYDIVCFHSHQAVEKSLKGALIENGVQPKITHLTAGLLSEVARFRPEAGAFLSDCQQFDRLYVPSRYPKAGLPSSTKEKAAECLDKASSIVEVVAKKVEAVPLSR